MIKVLIISVMFAVSRAAHRQYDVDWQLAREKARIKLKGLYHQEQLS